MEPKTIVLRIENADGTGPYRVDFDAAMHMGEWSKQPAPTDDGIYGFEGLHFGFKSLEQLKNWFPCEALERLKAAGCFLTKYEVPKHSVMEGGKQLVFDKRKAELLEVMEVA